ncbi:MAG: glycerol-3-phosphate 1-O-acyltransferase PlsY [Actinomycetales bacterium]
MPAWPWLTSPQWAELVPMPAWLGLAVVLGYLLGSISPAVAVARVFGIDIRAVGSGNPGATNVGRTLGVGWAILVGVLDVLKGLVPALAFGFLAGELAGELAGLAAVVGHVTSPWLRGRGGKGVATALGAILGVQAWLAIPVLVAFAVGVVVWRRVGLGAVLGAVALAFSGPIGWVIGWCDGADAAFALGLAAVVLARHRRNVQQSWSERRDEPRA